MELFQTNAPYTPCRWAGSNIAPGMDVLVGAEYDLRDAGVPEAAINSVLGMIVARDERIADLEHDCANLQEADKDAAAEIEHLESRIDDLEADLEEAQADIRAAEDDADTVQREYDDLDRRAWELAEALTDLFDEVAELAEDMPENEDLADIAERWRDLIREYRI